ncbi:MAG: KEOPS complex subunit Pcc1 [Candidatus Altiarchaeota archaeon]
MNSLRVLFEIPREDADVICESVGIEASSVKHERSNVRLHYEDGLVLDVEAKDLHAMRAAVNTYLRWISMAQKLIE